MNLYSSRSHTIFRMVYLCLPLLFNNCTTVLILMPLNTQVIESRERVDENEPGDSCDAVRVSVLVHAISYS